MSYLPAESLLRTESAFDLPPLKSAGPGFLGAL
jgi:hypothetical protein